VHTGDIHPKIRIVTQSHVKRLYRKKSWCVRLASGHFFGNWFHPMFQERTVGSWSLGKTCRLRRARWTHVFLFSHCGYFMLFHVISHDLWRGASHNKPTLGSSTILFCATLRECQHHQTTHTQSRAVFAWFTLREVSQLLQAVGGSRLTHHHWLRRYTKWLHPLDTNGLPAVPGRYEPRKPSHGPFHGHEIATVSSQQQFESYYMTIWHYMTIWLYDYMLLLFTIILFLCAS